MPARVEVGAQPRLLVAADARHAGRARDRAVATVSAVSAVVRDAAVALARVGERDAQARDRHTAEAGGGVEDGPTSMPQKPSRVAVPTMPGPMHDDRGVGIGDVAGDRERAVHRDRFVVAAERVPARDRRVDEAARSRSCGDEVGERERQRRAVGHDVGEPRVGACVLERDRDRRELAVQRGGDDGHPVDRVDVGELGPVLLGAADVGLQARVAAP